MVGEVIRKVREGMVGEWASMVREVNRKVSSG